ncbi:hypothetical protein ACIPW5_30515 [Streptomyces sp. NPDC090077]|uniref:hypothetical protein n=1 Tax=Streptomyces sp. NPDC090077 TaxID=3365938 RepID=UPI00381C034D
MRSLRAFTAPLLALPLLALAGCGGGGADIGAGGPRPASSAPSSSPSSSSPVPPPASPATPSEPARTAACTATAGLDTTALGTYLKGLKASDSKDVPSLFIVDDGVYFRLKDTQPPCEAVTVKLGHFRVDMARSADSAGYSFTYGPIRTRTLAVGPAEGKADGSEPPATARCAGVLSVVYVGRDLAVGDLPHDLPLPPKDSVLDWSLVDVRRDGVLGAVFKPPAGARDC